MDNNKKELNEEILKKEQEVENVNTEEEKLLEEKQQLELNDVVAKQKWIRVCIFLVFAIMICLGTGKYYEKNVVGTGYLYKVGNYKITEQEFNGINEINKLNGGDEQNTLFFIVDNLILSDKAKQENITVSDDEVNSVQYPYYKKEIALSNKLKEQAKEKVDNVTEDELKKFYEDNKDLFVKEGDIKYVAIQTEQPLPINHKVDTSKLTILNAKISEIMSIGLSGRDLEVGTSAYIEYNEKSKAYRYLYFVDKNITDYYTYEESKDKLKQEYERSYGVTSINLFASSAEQALTIESSKPLNANDNSKDTEIPLK